MFVRAMPPRTSRNNIIFRRTVSRIHDPHERIEIDAGRHICGRSKVNDLDIAFCRQQKVIGFDISMYNANGMQSFHAIGYLSQNALDCLDTSI